jgi:hypothetical protein
MQVRTPDGKAFWSFSPEQIIEITDSTLAPVKVSWGNRSWLYKCDSRSLNEVLGYQIATAFLLPLKPWVAFQLTPTETLTVGLLIEWWQHPREAIELTDLRENEILIARALAFDTLMRTEGECAHWYSDAGGLCLYDLDGIGPRFEKPGRQFQGQWYSDDPFSAFEWSKAEAEKAGVGKLFRQEVNRLSNLDFQEAIDLSGLRDEFELTDFALSSLTTRQLDLKQLLIAIE